MSAGAVEGVQADDQIAALVSLINAANRLAVIVHQQWGTYEPACSPPRSSDRQANPGTVTIDLGDTSLRVTDQHGELLATVPRHSRGEISRFKASGKRHAVNCPAGGK